MYKVEKYETEISELKEQIFEFQLEKETLVKRYNHEKLQIEQEINLIKDKSITNKLMKAMKKSSLRLDGD